jgi:hypothetical protein
MVTNYRRFTLTETISTEQKNFFEEYGFIHFENFINADAVDEIIKASEEVQTKWLLNNTKR